MDATLHLYARDFFKAAHCILDRIFAWFVIPDAACQSLGYVLRKEPKDRLPHTAWYVKFQFTVVYRNLTRIGDLDRILAVLLLPQREFLAFDLLESSCGKEIEHHILRTHDLRIRRTRAFLEVFCLLAAVFQPAVHQR